MRIFLAGATGATGTVFAPLAAERHALTLHVRPQSTAKSPLGQDPRAAIFDLGDHERLVAALRGVDAVVSLVGTMKKRFEKGDTYESSDLASTRQLVRGAQDAGVPRFLLLSSVGAGSAGAYLQMKGECERMVRESGLQTWIFRPSMLVSPENAEGTHGARWAPPGAVAVGGLLAKLPGVGAVADRYRPIPLDVLSRAMLAALEGPPGIFEGTALWRLAEATS